VGRVEGGEREQKAKKKKAGFSQDKRSLPAEKSVRSTDFGGLRGAGRKGWCKKAWGRKEEEEGA